MRVYVVCWNASQAVIRSRSCEFSQFDRRVKVSAVGFVSVLFFFHILFTRQI